MSITLNTLAYSQDSVLSADRVVYTGPSHTFGVKDTITLGRTAPKATSTYRGNAKSVMKRLMTVTLDDGSTSEAFIEINALVPVGTAKADIDKLRDDAGDFLLGTDGDDLIYKHDLLK